MRIQVGYVTRYEYDTPAKLIVQVLRMTPRGHEGQHVLSWRVETDADVRLVAGEDALGNTTHALSLAGPVKRLVTRVTGEVETWDTGGVVEGAVERFPPMVYLRDTPLTRTDAALRDFAEGATSAASGLLPRLHALLAAVKQEMAFETERTDAGTSAAEAFELRHGVCQDLAHIFIGCARSLGAPARYVSGHLARSEGQIDQEASHAWAEAYVEDLGWVGFDPTNGICPTDRYVRVAVGLDYLGAAPVRGSRYGGSGEHMDVKLRVAPSGR
ncbi:transglutaminase family protein [Caulobacter sp. S45]|uniref:transglutaminase family protein n=1 Tax=Caulobacter sp. S45 TaxID=1641861 RepID=UPI0015777BDF|nr:transglutaminase family protein [Caulobacter sp. S45]